MGRVFFGGYLKQVDLLEQQELVVDDRRPRHAAGCSSWAESTAVMR